MRLLLVTDAWEPQTNGVVSTLRETCRELTAMGVTVERISPEGFRTIACPSYPEIRLAVLAQAAVEAILRGFSPDAVHIATEGPLGHAARSVCLRLGMRFTTSYHTRFPEYLRARWPVPLALSYRYLRWFHGAAAQTMVSTASMEHALQARGFRNIRRWSRGVDTVRFRPRAERASGAPTFVFVGRVAVEKNVEAFLYTPLPGSKLVVGDGPARSTLQERFPEARFAGMLKGDALVDALAGADVMVFPSRTDTFGLVMLEAMACGTPVAAYPVTGPLDVVEHGVTGWLAADLGVAARSALQLDRNACRRAAEQCSWQAAAAQFLGNLVPCRASTYPFPLRVGKRRLQHADPAH